jgi:glycerol uptake facilitator-like aquaporin
MFRKLAAEFLGTAILVFLAVGSATLMFGFRFDGGSVAAGVVATALAFGLTLLALKSMIHIGAGGAFIFEAVLTAIFVFVVLRVTSATANAATAAIAIGLTLTVVHLAGIPITGTSVNPARSLGPAVVTGGVALSQVWLFIVAPLVGGVVAAGLHRLLYREEGTALAAESQQAAEAEHAAVS